MTLAEAQRARRPLAIAAAWLGPLVLCALLSTVRAQVTAAASALAIVLVVVAVAATGDRVAGLMAALSGAAWFDFFLTEPYLTFAIRDADDVEITVLLLLIGGGVTELALWGRRQQERASLRAGYLDGVLEASEAISVHRQPAEVLADNVAGQIGAVLGVARCRFVVGPVHDGRFAVLGRDGVVRRGEREVDLRDGLPTDEETVLPVHRGDTVLGHFVLTSAADVARPTGEQRRVALILADQLAGVLTTG